MDDFVFLGNDLVNLGCRCRTKLWHSTVVLSQVAGVQTHQTKWQPLTHVTSLARSSWFDGLGGYATSKLGRAARLELSRSNLPR
jgi:hypothetical protein